MQRGLVNQCVKNLLFALSVILTVAALHIGASNLLVAWSDYDVQTIH